MKIKHSFIFIREVRIKTANVDFLYFDIFKSSFCVTFFQYSFYIMHIKLLK